MNSKRSEENQRKKYSIKVVLPSILEKWCTGLAEMGSKPVYTVEEIVSILENVEECKSNVTNKNQSDTIFSERSNCQNGKIKTRVEFQAMTMSGRIFQNSYE